VPFRRSGQGVRGPRQALMPGPNLRVCTAAFPCPAPLLVSLQLYERAHSKFGAYYWRIIAALVKKGAPVPSNVSAVSGSLASAISRPSHGNVSALPPTHFAAFHQLLSLSRH
jgi:hypothetical protein